MTGITSIILLSLVGLLCLVGVFHPLYKDTLAERIGMSLVGVWCLARVGAKIDDPHTEPVHMMLHVGMAVFAVGMAWAKFKARHKIRRNFLWL